MPTDSPRCPSPRLPTPAVPTGDLPAGARPLAACRGHSARHNHAPRPFYTHSPPSRRRFRDSPPHTSTAPPHRAYPARQRHRTRANPTRLAAPSAVHQPSLRNRPLPPDAHPHRAVPPLPTPPPPSTSPALSPSVGKRRSIIATVPDHDNLIPPPHVCVASLEGSQLLCTLHVRGYAQLSRGRVDIRYHAFSLLWISPESPRAECTFGKGNTLKLISHPKKR